MFGEEATVGLSGEPILDFGVGTVLVLLGVEAIKDLSGEDTLLDLLGDVSLDLLDLAGDLLPKEDTFDLTGDGGGNLSAFLASDISDATVSEDRRDSWFSLLDFSVSLPIMVNGLSLPILMGISDLTGPDSPGLIN